MSQFFTIRWLKYWSFSFSISPSNGYSGLISFRMDCLDLLAVQGTLESLLQHPQLKSINSSALSFLYSPNITCIHDYWKNLDWSDLHWQSNVSVFNMLFKFVIVFLSRSKHLLISWLQSPSAVIWGPKHIKQRHYFGNKGPSSQGYGFSKSHVWMWELDYKGSWAPKNWCF